jgi:hypothetical protein
MQCGIMELHSKGITEGLLHTSVNQIEGAAFGGLDRWFTD